MNPELQKSLQVTALPSTLDGYMLIILLIMIAAGILGGVANYFLSDRGPVGKLATIDMEDEEVESFGAVALSDLSWKDIFDADACTLCKRCQDRCPAYNSGKPLSPMKVVNQIGEMASMAQSMRDLRPENITFVTMPFTYSSDGSNVLINEPVANEIWTAIRNDEQWPKPVPAGADALTVAPADIAVLVSNGNGRDNAATDAAADLAAVGFGIAGLSMADASTYPESVVVYNPADAEAARTLAQSVTGSVLREDPAAASGRLQLIVGANYSGAQSVAVARQPEGTAADPLPVTADQSICAS